MCLHPALARIYVHAEQYYVDAQLYHVDAPLLFARSDADARASTRAHSRTHVLQQENIFYSKRTHFIARARRR